MPMEVKATRRQFLLASVAFLGVPTLRFCRYGGWMGMKGKARAFSERSK